jgi:hypothetical protein
VARRPAGASATERRPAREPAAAQAAPSAESATDLEAQKITAPSIGPHTVIEREPAEERLKRHEQSGVDAMGHDKRRQVVGGRYSPSLGRQATVYGIFAAVIAALVIGFVLLANELDQPPETVEAEAPWAGSDAPQRPPEPLQ